MIRISANFLKPDNYMLPNLTIPDSKTEQQKWGEEVMNGIEKYYDLYFSKTKVCDNDNHDLYKGIFSEKQYNYVTDTWGSTNPARLVNYPITQHIIERIVGEFVAQPLKFNLEIVNEDAIVRKFDQKIAFLTKAMMYPYLKKIEQETGIKITEENMQMAIPEDMNEFANMNFRDNTEDVMFNGIENLIKKYDLTNIFKHGLYSMAIVNKAFYKVDEVNGNPVPRFIDDRNIIYDLVSGQDDLEKSDFVFEQRLMTVNEIINEFGRYLNKKQVNDLEKLRNATPQELGNMYTNYSRWFKFSDSHLTHILVWQGEWKGHKNIKVKINENKYAPDYPHIKFLQNNYDKKKGENIEQYPYTETWEGVRIGIDTFIRIRPAQFNFRREEWGYCNSQFSYVGGINDTFSLIQTMSNIAILYNITMFHIELIMSRSAGKAIVYDIAQLPPGLKFEDVIYQAKNHGFVWINTAQEGTAIARTFNQFHQIDFSMSNALTQLINLKMILEQTLYTMTGVNEGRLGMSNPNQAVGVEINKVQQSTFITQPLYYTHIRTIEKVLTRMSDLAKKTWAGKERFVFPLGDRGVKMIELLAKENLSLNDYSIYIENSFKDMQSKQKIEQLGEAALRGGQIGFLDIVKIINADSSREAERILEKGMKIMQQMQMQQRQEEMQMQQQALQDKSQMEQGKLQVLQGSNLAKVEAAKVAGRAKIEAEKIEQGKQSGLMEQQFQNDIDKMALESSMTEQPENAVEQRF